MSTRRIVALVILLVVCSSCGRSFHKCSRQLQRFTDRSNSFRSSSSSSASALVTFLLTLSPRHARCALPSVDVSPYVSTLQGRRLSSKRSAGHKEAVTIYMSDGSARDESEKPAQPEGDFDKIKVQLSNFWQMSKPYFDESEVGRNMFLAMIVLTLLNSGVSVAFSYVLRDFYSALSAKDTELFQQILLKFGGALAVAVPTVTYYRFQREQLSNHWREWMTDRVLQLYYSDRVYYSVERGSEIDNPDQRIAEDVNSFTSFSLSFFISIVTSIIDLASFSSILFSIQPELFGAIITYAVFGTITTTFIGKSLIGLRYGQLQMEADLRYALVRIRENAESIAFYAGEDIEGKEVSKRLRSVVENKKDINVAQRNLEAFTNAYRYLVQVLPVAVVSPQYFAGKIEMGVVTQSSGAFNHILSDLSILVNQFESLSTFSAGIDRLASFMQAMRELDMGRSVDSALMRLPNVTLSEDGSEASTAKSDSEQLLYNSSIELIERQPALDGNSFPAAHVLRVSDFSLSTPDRKRLLIEDLDVSLKQGENLLIVGNSGAGKSSFLRAIAGLWTSGSGIIERASNEDVYFLPQKPYCSIGTLKEQLLYPNIEALDSSDYPDGHILSRSHLMKQSFSDQDLLDILRRVDLEQLPFRAGDGDPVKGLGTVLDWSNTLSLGEQQRLAFGRLLVNRPYLAILDEATSALDIEAEARMYKLLDDMAHDKNIMLTYISVGHRPSLLNYHDTRLRLNGGKQHALEQIDRSRIDQSPSLVKNM